MTAGRSIDQRRRRRTDGLLADYTARHGDAIRRQQSVVALRAARIEAELAYKARGTFLAHMNHELRTPLNAIMGFAGLLKEADAYGFGEAQKAEYLDHILQSSELLLSHINTLLEVADAESGGAKLDKRAFAVAELIEDAVTDLTGGLAERDVALSADVADALPQVVADPDRIETAIRHLVRFAGAGIKAGGAIRLSARGGLSGASASWVYVSVSASGDARTKAQIDDALAVFERVHEGLHRGLGHQLSLPIAKSFVELNGGRFNVKAAPGGWLYRFALPRAAADAEAASRPLDLASLSVAS